MDQPFRTRDESRARVKKAILALPFKKNDSGNYNYADAQIFIKQFFVNSSTNIMSSLLMA